MIPPPSPTFARRIASLDCTTIARDTQYTYKLFHSKCKRREHDPSGGKVIVLALDVTRTHDRSRDREREHESSRDGLVLRKVAQRAPEPRTIRRAEKFQAFLVAAPNRRGGACVHAHVAHG